MTDEVEYVKMNSLNAISTSAFKKCTINEFDAPYLKSITVDEEYYSDNITFIVGKKNF